MPVGRRTFAIHGGEYVRNVGKTKGKLLFDWNSESLESQGEIDVNIVPTFEPEEAVQFKGPDFSLSIDLNEESKELFRKLAYRTRVKERTNEQTTQIVAANEDRNKAAKGYYFGPTFPENQGRIYLPAKQYEVLAEIIRFVRRRETAFAIGVFCPKCGKPNFKKKKCSACDENLEDMPTICPNCGPSVDVKYEDVCPQCFRRTDISRYINIGDDGMLKTTLFYMLKANIPFHFFTGMAHIKHTDKGEKLNLQKQRFIYGFDLALDIDGETIAEAHTEAKKASDYLNKLGVPFKYVFSGSKGFHLWIGYLSLQQFFNVKREGEFFKPDEVTKTLQDIGKLIKDESGAKIDTSVLGGQRQLIRVPWTYHYSSGLVCTPLSPGEFEFDFKMENYSPEKTFQKNVKAAFTL